MSQTIADPLSLDRLLDPDTLPNPYPFYHRLRETEPIHHDEQYGWVLTRHADVIAALRDPRMSAERLILTTEGMPPELLDQLAPAMRAFARQMLFLDPPDHTRLRGLVTKAFTPRTIAQMRERIQAIVDAMLDQFADAREIDLMHELAFPLPVAVIASMLGIPSEDHPQFTRWTADFGSLIDGRQLTPMEAFAAFGGLTNLMEYFRRAIAEHRAHPRDDLLQALIAADDRGDVLNEDELLGNCMLLLAAGHGTTTDLIGNSMLALLRNPDQLARLRDDAGLAESGVTEFLRYDGTVQMTSRLAKEDFAIAGQPIKAGESVMIVLGAANHDPAQFADPDRLDLTRAENRHVAFGHGIHYCVGAPLAHLETQIVFTTLLRRFPALRLNAESFAWQPSIVFRGVISLPIALR